MDMNITPFTPATQPLLKQQMVYFYKTFDSWSGTNDNRDFSFEEFFVGNESDITLELFPDGNSIICFEFKQNGAIRACFLGKLTRTKKILFRKNYSYFAVKIPANYVLYATSDPLSSFVNRFVKLESFTDTFHSFPWETFPITDYQTRITLFQQHVKAHFPYYRNELIDYILTESLNEIEPPSIKTLAENIGVTDRYIRKLFAEQLGLSPKKIIQFLRLQQAIKQLLEQDSDISKTSVENNFYDHPHFNKFFKQQTSYSPTEFKKLIK